MTTENDEESGITCTCTPPVWNPECSMHIVGPDILWTADLCDRPRQEGDGCYCDSLQADTKWCRFATWKHKQLCIYHPGEEELREQHKREAPVGIDRPVGVPLFNMLPEDFRAE